MRHFLLSLATPLLLLQKANAGNIQHTGCELYLAESTIPNAGLGVFTAVEKAPGDTVGNGDVCVPLLELDWHNGRNSFNPFSDYVWAGEVMGMKFEVGSQDIEAICPGLDCAINCNLALINVGKSKPVHDKAGLHRTVDPGAGANTPYHNGTTRVIRKIPAGGELFKFYGDSWFITRQIFDTLPLSTDFPKAQQLLEKCSEVYNQPDLHQLLVDIRSIWNSRTLNALPTSYEQAELAVREDIAATYQQAATRGLDWLEEHGKCIDHILPGQSTLEGAGHGAFTKRDIAFGGIITGSPLHHIPTRGFMDIYDSQPDEEGRWQRGQYIGRQLIMNYCYGHGDSSVFLCPYGSGVNYINHNQTLVNVKIQWAKDGTTAHMDSWFEKSPPEMALDSSSHLAFDFVATRHIKKGEELFMDYGDAWEQAWQAHTIKWKPEHAWAHAYLNGHEWNERMKDTPLRTEAESFYDPYPTTLQIRCHTRLVDIKQWRSITQWEWSVIEYGYPCRILKRERGDDELVYDVEITTEAKDRWDDFRGERISIQNKVPREAIRFLDLPYTSDIHLRRSFRHEIGIPDDMLPNAWRNADEGDSSDSRGIPTAEDETASSTAESSSSEHRSPEEL